MNQKDIAERAFLTYFCRLHFSAKKSSCPAFFLASEGVYTVEPMGKMCELPNCFSEVLVLQATSCKQSLSK